MARHERAPTNRGDTPDRAFWRCNFGRIDLEVTVEDPMAYTRPGTVTVAGWQVLPDEELIESICENEKGLPHMVGK